MADGIVDLSALAPGGETLRIGVAEVFGGLGIQPAGIEDLGETEVQEALLGLKDVRIVEQSPQRGQVLVRQFAAQQCRQLTVAPACLGSC